MIALTDILQRKQEIANRIIELQREMVFNEGKHQCLLEMEMFLVKKADDENAKAAEANSSPLKLVPSPKPESK